MHTTRTNDVEMADTSHELWCLIEGETTHFPVTVTDVSINVNKLKEIIKEAEEVDHPAHKLNLWKVNVDLVEINDDIFRGKYRFDTADKQPLRPSTNISQVWPQSPSKNHLHIYVTITNPNIGSPTPVDAVGEPIGHPNLLQLYEPMFVKLKDPGKFREHDIKRNQIYNAQTFMMGPPDFVSTFEQGLVRKPLLRHEMLHLASLLTNPGSYFSLPGDSVTGDESHGESRYATSLEVHAACHVSLYDWEKGWQPEEHLRYPLKEHAAEMIFFGPLDYTPMETATTLRDKASPITIVVQCEGEVAPRRYNPRSDFSISRHNLPRLLVEVNSTPGKQWPMDLVRMLTTGAYIVRFANRFLTTFHQRRNFVFCAIFIWDSGHATRYTLFQQQGDERVFYNKRTLSLNDSDGRMQFLCHLFNLCGGLDQDQDTESAVNNLNYRINSQPMKSMYPKESTINSSNGHGGRKRAKSNCGHAGGGGGDDHSQLRAHDYEVEPEVFVDASGGEWGPIYKMPDHIFTVYRPMDSRKKFIAKKVREDSNELEMLRFLDTIPRKSDHIISLVDSFHGWAILPKLATVKVYVEFGPKLSESKVSQLCLGLIKGLTYLHEHRIAHRDLKPDNLLVNNENFRLIITDFDIAMRVEDEDEEVDDQCGTKHWMAPEVEGNLRHSPIKADRWSCGHVILYFLDKSKQEGKHFRPFATKLTAHDPKRRPSLLEWESLSDAPLLDVAVNRASESGQEIE